MSRAGAWDKSHLMRQIEKYADVYTSRVSNLLRYTPYGCFSSSLSQSLAHDKDLTSYLQRLEKEGNAPFGVKPVSARSGPIVGGELEGR